jgi:hypothetical protein
VIAAWNRSASAVFDALLAPFGHGPAWVDLLVWSVVAGIFALWVYKKVSNQSGIARNKDRIQAHLYEIRLFRHDPIAVLASTGRVLVRNLVYLGYNLVPMAVLLLPMLAVLAQLEAHYAFDPVPVGTVELLQLQLDPKAGLSPRDVHLELPQGVALDAPPVRTPDGEVYWRLRAEAPGDQVLTLRVGDEVLTKTWAVGGPHRKVPLRRLRGLEAFLYPGEPALPQSSPVERIALAYPERDLGILPGGELGILANFFGLSLLAGFALKGRFGVTL